MRNRVGQASVNNQQLIRREKGEKGKSVSLERGAIYGRHWESGRYVPDPLNLSPAGKRGGGGGAGINVGLAGGKKRTGIQDFSNEYKKGCFLSIIFPEGGRIGKGILTSSERGSKFFSYGGDCPRRPRCIPICCEGGRGEKSSGSLSW